MVSPPVKARLEKAEKRSVRSATAYDNAKKRLDANPDDELTQLKFTKAEAEFKIAQIEQGKLEIEVMERATDPNIQEDAKENVEEDEDKVEETEDQEYADELE